MPFILPYRVARGRIEILRVFHEAQERPLRIGPGGTFDLDTWHGTGGISYTLSAEAGVLVSSNGSIY